MKPLSTMKGSEEDNIYKLKFNLISSKHEKSQDNFIRHLEASRNRQVQITDSKTASLINLDGSCLKFDF